jgi:peptidoglycan hydrolase-like protein with peptidoglycan-binding domain
MLLAKVACTSIALMLLATGPPATHLNPVSPENKEARDIATIPQFLDVKATQQQLSDKGHYRGKVDGVLGLRTRASIRGFQKDENLRVTGQLDVQTASRLGVPAEQRVEIVPDPNISKPSARIKWGQDPRREGRRPRKPNKAINSPTATPTRREELNIHEKD